MKHSEHVHVYDGENDGAHARRDVVRHHVVPLHSHKSHEHQQVCNSFSQLRLYSDVSVPCGCKPSQRFSLQKPVSFLTLLEVVRGSGLFFNIVPTRTRWHCRCTCDTENRPGTRSSQSFFCLTPKPLWIVKPSLRSQCTFCHKICQARHAGFHDTAPLPTHSPHHLPFSHTPNSPYHKVSR